MTYLYGDSTDSGLELNYIELLRDFLDFAVQIMLSEQRIDEAEALSAKQKTQVNAELENLRTLGEAVVRALNASKTQAKKSATNKSIAELRQMTQDNLRSSAEQLKGKVVAGDKEISVRKQRERAGNAKITERLLLQHQLPDSKNTVAIAINQEGNAYDARVTGSCKQGLNWTFAAEIPAKNQFHQVLKVSSLAPELSIDLPEMSGFVRKSVKLKPYRVSPLYVTGLASERKEFVLTLRTTAVSAEPTGLNVRATPSTKGVTVQRIEKGEESAPFQLSDGDAAELLKICIELNDERVGLVDYRAKLVALLFDGKELSECPDPKILLRRLIDRIGPIIRKIAKHSLAESELVLKRVLANDRREEIFASRADLIGKLSGVSIGYRGIFAPLGLGELGIGGDLAENEALVDSPTRKQSSLTALEDNRVDSLRSKRPSESQTLAGIEDEETKVGTTVHEMTAMPLDEDDTDSSIRAVPPARARGRNSQGRTKVASPPSLKTPRAAPAPAGDSIDIALAELESES